MMGCFSDKSYRCMVNLIGRGSSFSISIATCYKIEVRKDLGSRIYVESYLINLIVAGAQS